MNTIPSTAAVRLADEIWIATALLHREHPDRRDFSVKEIVERAARENLGERIRPGLTVHAYLHCVANKAPNPTGYRVLYATGPNTRRLFRPSDLAHPHRTGKITPRRDQIPCRYHPLLDWYENEFAEDGWDREDSPDPILALRGLGGEIWQDEDPDQYVQRLREGWE